MATLKDIRRRIASVKNTQQVTKAMKMVAAAKLRRAQQAMDAARPYSRKLAGVVGSVAARVEPGAHPMLATVDDPQKVLMLVITSDRGLCGGFNANLLRFFGRYMKAEGAAFEAVDIMYIGRKAKSFFAHRDFNVIGSYDDVWSELGPAKARKVARSLTRKFESDGYDAVFVLYNDFKSAISQDITVQQLLPIETTELPDGDFGQEHIYEPGRAELLDSLLPRHVETQLLRSLLESVAAEHGARMGAMESATTNAGKLIDRLTLQANRARQAAITKELLEIVAGAEALGG